MATFAINETARREQYVSTGQATYNFNFQVNVVDELSFAHGYYQNVTHWGSNFILINLSNNKIKNILSEKILLILKVNLL